MCWSATASIAMVAAGTGVTAIAVRRKMPVGIWMTLGYFTFMEALQVAGYAVLDACGTSQNQAVTVLSYLHIVFQPFFINAFAMELVPNPVKARIRLWVYGACGASAAVMLAQLLPMPSVGSCVPGSPLCGETWCTVSGNWHIAWNVPYNALMVPFDQMIGRLSGFPTYLVAAFVLPLAYGAWRFVLLHALAGPILAIALTDNANEAPAVWCLFSIAILLIGLSTRVRRTFTASTWWGIAAA